MKLFNYLCRGFKIPGARFRGKVRMVKIVTPLSLNNLKTDFKIEEQNMLYLRNPYLTLEQSKLLTAELKKDEPKLMTKVTNERDAKFSSKSVKIYDKLKHIRHREDWDVIKP